MYMYMYICAVYMFIDFMIRWTIQKISLFSSILILGLMIKKQFDISFTKLAYDMSYI